MKKYIWLNPVVIEAYDIIDLELELSKRGFNIVNPSLDNAKIVLDKYETEIKGSECTIVDSRCPLITKHLKEKGINAQYSKTDPILIHIAKELSSRIDLIDAVKYIITPCKALKEYGNRLCLSNITFLTWDEFINQTNIKLKSKKLSNSPIPFGFFDSLRVNVKNVYKSNIDDITQEVVDYYDLIEGLYCENGCHNGDGVESIGK